MAKQPRARQQRQQARTTTDTADTTNTVTNETRPAPHLDLAAEAILEGWTREQVIAALIGRVKRDQTDLAYRKPCNRRTSYDGQVQQDMRALALAACWLEAEHANSLPLTIAAQFTAQSTTRNKEPLACDALSSARTERLSTR